MDTQHLKLAIGQRICAGFTGTEIPPELRSLIHDHKVGNILLFSRNVVSFGQLSRLCRDLTELVLQETGLPPLIMMDEEGGAVSRVGHLAGETPSAGAVGATGDIQNATSLGRIIGKRLRAAGVNMNLGPVLDCLSRPASAVMGNRCFSESPETVAAFGRAYIEGLRETGVLSCGKHFPGHGDTDVDSHFGLPVINKSLDAARKVELVSFREAIAAGTDAIMSAHVVYPELDPSGVPATISSRILQGLLREELGFKGLIISDGMEMDAMRNLFPIDEGVCRALKAGVDIALVCHEPAEAATACRRMERAVREGDMDPASLEAHLERIQAVKRRLPLLPAPEAGKADFFSPQDQVEAKRIMAASVRTESGSALPSADERTLFVAVSSRRASPAADGGRLNAADYVARHFGSDRAVTESAGELREQISRIAGADGRSLSSAVFFLEKGDRLAEMKAEAVRLAELGVPVTAVALDTPFVLQDLPGQIAKIIAWQYQALAIDQVIRILEENR